MTTPGRGRAQTVLFAALAVAIWLAKVTGYRPNDYTSSESAHAAAHAGNAQAADPPARKRLIISVDVEALPARQESDHVNRLIWGRFGDAEVGIGRMMQVAESHGVRLTFFLDYCEAALYPGAFERITAEIVRRGHDVQLHAHPEVWPADFWCSLGLVRPPARLANSFDIEQAGVLFDFLMRTAKECGAPTPVAYRAGGWRFNAAALHAMADNGLMLSFNYKAGDPRQPNNDQNLPLFQWSNGVYEVPLGVVRFAGRACCFSFDSDLPLDDAAAIRGCMDSYFEQFGLDSVLVMIMHSWSFCVLDSSSGYFSYRNDERVGRFDAFLAHLGSDFTVITASELATAIRSGVVKPALVQDVELMDTARYPPAK